MKEQDNREAAFLGKITAGITHEIKNVLAIIRESSGLMEDLLSLAQQETFAHGEKFSNALSTIHEQVNRGVELVNRLNRLAHSPDEPEARVDLNEQVKDIDIQADNFLHQAHSIAGSVEILSSTAGSTASFAGVPTNYNPETLARFQYSFEI